VHACAKIFDQNPDTLDATMKISREDVLKVAALVQVSVRRVYIKLSSAYPWQEIFRLCHQRLMAMCAADG